LSFLASFCQIAEACFFIGRLMKGSDLRFGTPHAGTTAVLVDELEEPSSCVL
jgi:hypothetical protein